MEELVQTLEGLDRPLADLDVTPGGQVFAITEKGSGKAEKGQRLFVNGQPFPVPEPIRYPILRALDESRLLLADSRSGGGENAWIVDTSGAVERAFRAGDAIADIIPLRSWLAVIYFDEAYGSSDGLDGVVLFDPAGEVAFRHNQVWQNENYIVDCYCAGRVGRDRLLYLGYPDFPIFLLDAVTRQETFWPAPDEIHGAAAVTVAGGVAFFHGNYGDRRVIHRWRFGDPKAERIGGYTGPLRGLPGGRFLAKGAAGYTIVSL